MPELSNPDSALYSCFHTHTMRFTFAQQLASMALFSFSSPTKRLKRSLREFFRQELISEYLQTTQYHCFCKGPDLPLFYGLYLLYTQLRTAFGQDMPVPERLNIERIAAYHKCTISQLDAILPPALHTATYKLGLNYEFVEAKLMQYAANYSALYGWQELEPGPPAYGHLENLRAKVEVDRELLAALVLKKGWTGRVRVRGDWKNVYRVLLKMQQIEEGLMAGTTV